MDFVRKRANAFFKTRNPKFDEIAEKRANQFRSAATEFKKKNPSGFQTLQKIVRGDEDRISANMGIWWAYLESVSRSICQDLDDAEGVPDLAAVFTKLILRKYIYASEYSAAAAGQFYLDQQALADFRQNPTELDRSKALGLKARNPDWDNISAFLSREILSLSRPELMPYQLTDEELKKLTRYLDAPEHADFKNKINEALTATLSAVNSGVVPNTEFETLKKYFDEQVRLITEHKLGRKAGRLFEHGIADVGHVAGGVGTHLIAYNFGSAVPELVGGFVGSAAAAGLIGVIVGRQLERLISQDAVQKHLYRTLLRSIKLSEFRASWRMMR